jgi:hypothetical protein
MPKLFGSLQQVFGGHLSKIGDSLLMPLRKMRPTAFLNPGAFPDTTWRTTTNNFKYRYLESIGFHLSTTFLSHDPSIPV